MSDPITPEVDQQFTREIRQLTLSLSQRSQFFAVFADQRAKCNNCVWDPVRKCSSGTYNGGGPKAFSGGTCPVCRGKGELETVRKVRVRANVAYPEGPDTPDLVIAAGESPDDRVLAKVLIEDDKTMKTASYYEFNGDRYKAVGQPRYRGLKQYVLAVYTLVLNK
jgi:hypothetical protein